MPIGRETAPLNLHMFSAGEGAADATKKMLKRPTKAQRARQPSLSRFWRSLRAAFRVSILAANFAL
jgi:hypothetical protein